MTDQGWMAGDGTCIPLDVAVHAATKALEGAYDWDGYNVAAVARIAVEAALPHLPGPPPASAPQPPRPNPTPPERRGWPRPPVRRRLKRAGAIQWYSDTLHKVDGERMAAEAELEATRAQLADLEMHAAELDREPCEDCYERCCGTREEPCRCHRAAAAPHPNAEEDAGG